MNKARSAAAGAILVTLTLGLTRNAFAEPICYALKARMGLLTKQACGDANALAFFNGFINRETTVAIDTTANLVTLFHRDDTWTTAETMVRGFAPYFAVWRTGTGTQRWTLILRVEPTPCVSQWQGPAARVSSARKGQRTSFFISLVGARNGLDEWSGRVTIQNNNQEGTRG